MRDLAARHHDASLADNRFPDGAAWQGKDA
jgi:hypothetical protein